MQISFSNRDLQCIQYNRNNAQSKLQNVNSIGKGNQLAHELNKITKCFASRKQKCVKKITWIVAQDNARYISFMNI